MKFELKNLKAYAIILFSTVYATYTSTLFLELLLNSLVFAVVGAVCLSVVAHAYLVEGVGELKNKRFNSSILVALILCATLAYFDLAGVGEKAKQDSLLPLQQQQATETQQLQQQITAVRETVKSNSQHTKKGNTNWAMYGTFVKSSKQLQQLEQQQEQLQQQHNKQLEQATVEKEKQQQGLTGLSIALLVLSTLVSFSVVQSNREPVNGTKKSLPTPTESTTPTFTTTVNKGLTTEEKIKMASDHIRETNQIEHEVLSKMFGINFSSVKKAKIMAGVHAS